MTELAIGLDIGGSWSRAALGDRNGNILRRMASPVEAGSSTSFLEHIDGLIESLVGEKIDVISGIGLGVAGRLDLKRGSLLFSPHTKLKDLEIRKHIIEKFQKPTAFLNDCMMAALAEKMIGAGVGYKNLVYVGIGTGIGSGVIIDNRILMGKDGNAHEVGHMIIDMDGRLPCECGGRGHWEAYTSGSGMPEYARLLAEDIGIETPLASRVRQGKIESKEIFKALYNGDRFAKHVINDCTRLNAMALANLNNLYDPEIIIIGGAVAIKNPGAVIEPLEAEVQKYSFNMPPKITATAFGEDSPLIGSILSTFEPSFSQP